ncbi:hypothetical protein ERJ70_15810 [Sediminibacillus dalangtanensis]|uniref:ABC-2 type transport system permease protein n=1 Tax=Sediminibacillus dalangtanensis TaxID=2729421 RepID=A0ABX7VX82_9BACI|nr:hypothetical protein [Sediminibacillus dalangtanensis]QTN00630.1 hypothetical protein ERJ70_15810 [Sediminibacillus dalangtanensis]
MNAFASLTKKELRMGMPVFLVPVIIFIVAVGAAAYFGGRSGVAAEAITGVSVAAVTMQIFYLIYYLNFSLKAEKKKLHLWLHNPLPGYSMLLAKLGAGLISMLATLLITGVTLIISAQSAGFITHLQNDFNLTNIGFFSGLHVVLIAIDLSIYFVFFYMIYLLFNRYFGGFISFCSTFVLFGVSTYLWGKFSETAIHRSLTSWGEIELNGFVFNRNFDTNGIEFFTEFDTVHVFLGSYLFETIIVLILFFAASWMLDRKVEV